MLSVLVGVPLNRPPVLLIDDEKSVRGIIVSYPDSLDHVFTILRPAEQSQNRNGFPILESLGKKERDFNLIPDHIRPLSFLLFLLSWEICLATGPWNRSVCRPV